MPPFRKHLSLELQMLPHLSDFSKNEILIFHFQLPRLEVLVDTVFEKSERQFSRIFQKCSES